MNGFHLELQAGYAIAFGVATLLFSWLNWPLCRRLFSALPDQGYALSRLTALATVGLLSWLLYAFDLITNSAGGIALTLLILLLLNLHLTRRDRSRYLDFSALRWSYILLIETLFFVVFASWLFIRWCDPNVAHTEQPMDFMMLQALWNNTTYPPQDLWLSGYPIGYYYFGYWLQHVFARLLSIPPALSYPITQAFWMAATISAAFGLGCNLAAAHGKKNVMLLGGALCAGGVALMSNPAGFISACTKSGHYWWWSASRTVQDGNTELITEFPFFSFLLGDNHPHLLALPLMLLFVACCINLLFRAAQNQRAVPNAGSPPPRPALSLAAMALLTGMLYMTNAWNVPTLFFLAMLTLLAMSDPLKHRLRRMALYLPGTILLILLLLLPYHLTAQSQFSGFTFFHPFHTGLAELALMFGYFIPGILLLLFCVVKTMSSPDSALPVVQKAGLILLAAGLLCILTPEIVYIRDVFNNRMNTVFKFYYQAWIFLALASACGIVETLRLPRLRFFVPLVLLFLITGLLYPVKALRDITRTFTPSPRGMDALAWFEQDHLETAQALQWLRAHAEADEVILVPEGVSYEPLTVMSSLYAGFPMLLGWRGHEQQWRGDDFSSMANARSSFLRDVFSSSPDAFPCHAPQWDSLRFLLLTRTASIRHFPPPPPECIGHIFKQVFSNRTVVIYEKE